MTASFGCTRTAAAEISVPFVGESMLYAAEGNDFFIVVRQNAEGTFCPHNGSVSYKQMGFSVTVTPLKLSAEGAEVYVKSGGEFLTSVGGMRYVGEALDVEDVTLIADGEETELYLELCSETDFGKVISLLYERCAEAGEVRTRFIPSVTGLYQFVGLYRDDLLINAVICDEKGNFLTDL